MMRLHYHHRWNIFPKEAYRIQEELKRRVILKNGFKKIEKIAGADVSFDREEKKAYAAVVLFSFPELEILEVSLAQEKVIFPYIPGLLSFREGRILLKTLLNLKQDPDLILFDGQGIAHPRGVGLATHLGVLLKKSTVGCAKSRLIGDYKEPGIRKGATSPLYQNGRRIGVVLRSREAVKPIFVSPGNLIDIETSAQMVLQCCRGYRIPEPLRLADIKGREQFRNKIKRRREVE